MAYSTFPNEEEPKPDEEKKPEESVPLARFNEVYGKWKDTERQVQGLEQRLGSLEQKAQEAPKPTPNPPEEPEPDPEEDPEAFKAYWRKRGEKSSVSDQAKPGPQRENLDLLVEAARMVWSDYDDVVTPMLAAIDRDPALKARIMGARNPASEAYRYAKELKQQQTDTKDQLQFEKPILEGDAFFSSADEAISQEEKQMAAKFGMDDKEWKGHKKAIAKDRARTFGQ